MPEHPLRHVTLLAVALTLCAGAPRAHGQVYKCTESSGSTTYSDTPCATGSGLLKLPGDPGRSSTDPNLCAQLLDETHRLAAEAAREAKRGRAESASSAKRRQKLDAQYAARCAGIARSEEKSK
jgi:Domain of unknown function (DUF4124)